MSLAIPLTITLLFRDLYPANYSGLVVSGNAKFYFKDGLFHREDGPALDDPARPRYYYLNGFPCKSKIEWFYALSDESKKLLIWKLDEL